MDRSTSVQSYRVYIEKVEFLPKSDRSRLKSIGMFAWGDASLEGALLVSGFRGGGEAMWEGIILLILLMNTRYSVCSLCM